jgi:NAD(P)-dependent dehydrogenase (short-subunit alcohol dehydrogenase family)
MEEIVIETRKTFNGPLQIARDLMHAYLWRPLASYSAETLAATMDELLAINVRGYLYAAMAAREALLQSRGSIIFTGSVASFNAGGGGIVYTLAKHAVVGVVRQLALELAPDIRVNCVGSLRG